MQKFPKGKKLQKEKPNKNPSHEYEISAKYPLVESILSCMLLNYFHRGNTEDLACKAQRDRWQGSTAGGISGSQMQHLGTCGELQVGDPQPGIHSCQWSLGVAVGSLPCAGSSLSRISFSVVQPHINVPPFARLLGNVCAAKRKPWNQLECWTSIVGVAELIIHFPTLLSTHATHF